MSSSNETSGLPEAFRNWNTAAFTTQVVGWYVWWLHEGRLQSWKKDFVWPKGIVETKGTSGILVHRHLSSCLAQARGRGIEGRLRPRRHPVIGIVQGWGNVEPHGDECFTVQNAVPLCLIADPVWDGIFDVLTRPMPNVLRPNKRIDTRRLELLKRAANHYGITYPRLQDAQHLGFFTEFDAKLLPDQ